MKLSLPLTIGLFCLATITRAGVVYSDGAISGQNYGYTVANNGLDWHVSDSFTVTSTTALGSVVAGLWTDYGFQPGTMSWELGSTPFASDIGSGTSPTINTFSSDTGFGYDVYASAFNLGGEVVGPGTYYLTLNDGSTDPTYWDVNYGPSTSYQSPDATFADSYSIPSESFTIYSNSVGVPDSASTGLLALLGVGALLVTHLRRRVQA